MKRLTGIAALVAALACGEKSSEPSTPCSSDRECKGNRICVEGTCQNPPLENLAYDAGISPERDAGPSCEENLDVCDGADNNCNGIVDELGCGRIYYTSNTPGLWYISLNIPDEPVNVSPTGSDCLTSELSSDGTKYLEREKVVDLIAQAESSIPLPGGCDSVYASSWVSDSQTIAFSCNSGSGEHGVYLTDLGATPRKVVDFPEEIYFSEEGISELRVSPDGQKIAFRPIMERGQKSQIYVVNVDGSNLRQVTLDESSKQFIKWNNTGRIFFHLPGEGLYSISADGSDQRPGLNDYLLVVFNPQYSKAFVAGGGKKAVWDLSSKEVYPVSDFPAGFCPIAWRE